MKKISTQEFNNKNLINIYKNWCYISVINKYIKNNSCNEFNNKIYNECLKFRELCENNNDENYAVIYLLSIIDNMYSSHEKMQLYQYCNLLTYENQLNDKLIDLFILYEKLVYINDKCFSESTYVIHNDDHIYVIFDYYVGSIENIVFNPNINIDINLFFDILQKDGISSHFILYIHDSFYESFETTDKYHVKYLDNLYIVCSINSDIQNDYITNIKIRLDENTMKHTTYVKFKKIKSIFDEYIIYKYILKEPIIKKLDEYEYVDLTINYKDKSYSCINNYYSNKTNTVINNLSKIKYDMCISSEQYYEIIYGFYLVLEKDINTTSTFDPINGDSIPYIITSDDITRNSFIKYMDIICNPISWIDIPSYDNNVINNVNITRDIITSIFKFCDKTNTLKLRLINKKFKKVIDETYKFSVNLIYSDINNATEMRKIFKNMYFNICNTYHFTNKDLESLQYIKFLTLTVNTNKLSYKDINLIKDNLESLIFDYIFEMYVDNFKFVSNLYKLKVLDLSHCYNRNNNVFQSLDFLTDKNSKLMINLEELYLPREMKETNVLISCLYNMKSLKKLSTGNIIFIGIPDGSLTLTSFKMENIVNLDILKFCPLLEELFLPPMMYSKYYTNIFKDYISYIPNLTTLLYNEMFLSSDDFNKIKSLKYLDIDYINIKDYTCFQNLIGLSISDEDDDVEFDKFNVNLTKLEYFKYKNSYIIKIKL